MVEALLTRFGGVKNVTWSRSTAPYLHPAALRFFAGEKLLGVLGEVHPAVAENFKFKTRAYVAEMNLNVLDESATNVGDVKDMPPLPRRAARLCLCDEGRDARRRCDERDEGRRG